MGDGVEKSHNDITNVLFCGFHFPASQNYTREYLKGYPFIKVSLSLSMCVYMQVISTIYIFFMHNQVLFGSHNYF